MPRNIRGHEIIKLSKARRQRALSRPELLQPSVARMSAAGPVSMALKAEDPETRRLIDEALAKRGHQLSPTIDSMGKAGTHKI